jgi:hypothetical protein
MQRRRGYRSIMKNKVGTLLDEITLRKLKEHAANEGRSMSGIIDEALTDHFEGNRGPTLPAEK